MTAFSNNPAKLNRIATRLMLILPLAIIVLLALAPVSALAEGTITGKITASDTREAMIGANVYLKGTTIGAVSKEDGSYTITNIPPGAYTLVASFVGYRTESSKINIVSTETVTANFTMKVDVFLGEEVVVTGIASRTSKEVAEVAVSRVAAAQLTEINNYQSVSQLVTGKVAGVSLAPSSGNAGSGFRFNIRSGGGLNGDEQPIIYIDGVRMDNSEFGGPLTDGFGVGGQGISLLASINPEDIEKMEILKGPAAAASYGTGGANGVVLITTKRGNSRAAAWRRGD
jgi:TonB-dependent SusC/RagA subfamily outer membrane receptor